MSKNPLKHVLDRFEKKGAAAPEPVKDEPKKRIRIRKPAKAKKS